MLLSYTEANLFNVFEFHTHDHVHTLTSSEDGELI